MDVKKIPIPNEIVKTLRIRILSGVILAPGVEAEAGEIYDVPRHLAFQLVGHNQAEFLSDAKSEESGVRVEKPTTRDQKPAKVDQNPTAKPIAKMNKAELVAFAKSIELEISEDLSKDEILAAIQAKQAGATV